MSQQFTTFYLGDDRFGIDVLLVKEINRPLAITDVAGAPDYIRGLLNLRGQIVTVMDLARRFGRPPCEITPTSRCIVLKKDSELRSLPAFASLKDQTGPDVVGLLVDRIGDMLVVKDGEIGPAPANLSGLDGKFFSGVINLKDELIVTICAKKVLRNE